MCKSHPTCNLVFFVWRGSFSTNYFNFPDKITGMWFLLWLLEANMQMSNLSFFSTWISTLSQVKEVQRPLGLGWFVLHCYLLLLFDQHIGISRPENTQVPKIGFVKIGGLRKYSAEDCRVLFYVWGPWSKPIHLSCKGAFLAFEICAGSFRK